jgi:site-specific recombinase XerD
MGRAETMKSSNSFPCLLESFFTERLMRQRQASSHTIAGYRDSFRLLLRFANERLNKVPSSLTIDDLDAPFICRFLDYLETERANGPRSRNIRLAAIHSFFRYVALTEPSHSAVCQRVLAIPTKRYQRKPVAFLSREEVGALLQAPDSTTWTGRRDQILLLVAVQTGLRVSELIDLRCQDITLDKGAHVHCRGKGRKQRCTPLRKEAAAALARWLRERDGKPGDALFPSVRGGSLSPDAVQYLLAKHVALARQRCHSLGRKKVTPHVLRHTAAMDLLQHGVDRSVIALWLGHESPETTDIYLHADLKLKENALARTTPRGVKPGRYRPSDHVLAFLESL